MLLKLNWRLLIRPMVDSIEHDPGSFNQRKQHTIEDCRSGPKFHTRSQWKKASCDSTGTYGVPRIFLLMKIHKSTIKGVEKTSPHREDIFVLRCIDPHCSCTSQEPLPLRRTLLTSNEMPRWSSHCPHTKRPAYVIQYSIWTWFFRMI